MQSSFATSLLGFTRRNRVDLQSGDRSQCGDPASLTFQVGFALIFVPEVFRSFVVLCSESAIRSC